MKHDYIEQSDLVDRYLQNRLDERERGEFEEHYLYCQRCQEELVLSGRLSGGFHQMDEEDRARAAVAQGTNGEATQGAESPHRYADVVSHPAFAAAASVLIIGTAAVIVDDWRVSEVRAVNARLVAELERARSPHANTPVLLLGATRGAGTGERPPVHQIRPIEPDGWIVLAMELPVADHPRYRAALRSSAAEPLWVGDSLVPDSNDQLVVSVHGSQMPPGDYVVQVEGLTVDDSWTAVASFTFRVLPP